MPSSTIIFFSLFLSFCSFFRSIVGSGCASFCLFSFFRYFAYIGNFWMIFFAKAMFRTEIFFFCSVVHLCHFMHSNLVRSEKKIYMISSISIFVIFGECVSVFIFVCAIAQITRSQRAIVRTSLSRLLSFDSAIFFLLSLPCCHTHSVCESLLSPSLAFTLLDCSNNTCWSVCKLRCHIGVSAIVLTM